MADAEVQLSAQRLQELMLWHGKDEGNLPPAATLVNLSRDTIAALSQLLRARTQLAELRTQMAQLFWSCDSSAIRITVLTALGPPPQSGDTTDESMPVIWQASPNGLPPRATTVEAREAPSMPQRAMG